MITIYTDSHRRQNGSYELIDGKLQPPVEKPERAERILAAVRDSGVGTLTEPEPLHPDWLARVHAPDYIAFLREAWTQWRQAHGDWDALPLNWAVRGMRQVPPISIDGKLSYYSFDAGTPITAGTWEAVTGSADVALTGAKRLSGGEHAVFSLCRPPGHHASRDVLGGYCFLNNAALAATYLRLNGCARVAILDIDYHHGNGTQAIFYDRADVLFVSIHADPRQEFPFFLGHGEETGADAGAGHTLNLPLPWGTGWDDGYARALETACGRVADYGPDALVVSLGVDTFEEDPISRFRLKTGHFPRIGRRLRALALPTLFVMEGGYAVDALGRNVAGVLEGFEAGG